MGSEAVDLRSTVGSDMEQEQEEEGANEEDEEIRGAGRETKNKDKRHTVSRSIGSEEELGIEPQYCLSPVSKESNSKSCLL